jgi:hypothetical protein
MRYLVGFICVLALGAMGCSGSGGSGGEIGDQFPAIDTLALTLNRVYDNGDQRGDEQYTFQVAELTVKHEWLRGSVPPESLPSATRKAMDQLVNVVQGVSYRINEDCGTEEWDYVTFPPKLSVVHAQDQLVLSVSDSQCADNNFSFVGPVMSCSDFEKVFTAIREIVPEVESETCADYW